MTSTARRATCRPIPRRGRQAGRGRGLAQPHRVGARPLAITDNLNFGNPERPRSWASSSAPSGHGEACRRSTSRSCRATSRSTTRPMAGDPADPDHRRRRPDRRHRDLGRLAPRPSRPRLVLIGETAGLARPVDLSARDARPRGRRAAAGRSRVERRNGDFVRGQIVGRRVQACHDLSDGGLLVALAEMCLAGGTGAGRDPGPRRRRRSLRCHGHFGRLRREIENPAAPDGLWRPGWPHGGRTARAQANHHGAAPLNALYSDNPAPPAALHGDRS
jgi:hypothetical protein